jgi:hypothetical protein
MCVTLGNIVVIYFKVGIINVFCLKDYPVNCFREFTKICVAFMQNSMWEPPTKRQESSRSLVT